ncbi:MAG: hypothetical protein K2X27_10625 [Candidatus Obscuribacterales bacterium]|nr:hypothetical protein [Candidatus Obscuribacterales bacterium]
MFDTETKPETKDEQNKKSTPEASSFWSALSKSISDERITGKLAEAYMPQTQPKPDSQNKETKAANTAVKDAKSSLKDLAADVTALSAGFASSYMLSKFKQEPRFSETHLRSLESYARKQELLKIVPQETTHKVNEKERPTDLSSDDSYVRKHMGNLQELAKKLSDPNFTRLYPNLKSTLSGSPLSANLKDGKLTLSYAEDENKLTQLVLDSKTGEMRATNKFYSPDRKFCLEEKVEGTVEAEKITQALRAVDSFQSLIKGNKQGYIESMNAMLDSAHKAKGVVGLKEAIATSKSVWESLGASITEPSFRNAQGENIPDRKALYSEIAGFTMDIKINDRVIHTIKYATDYNKKPLKHDFERR